MDPPDEMAAKIEAALRRSTGAVAGSDDVLRKFDERSRSLKDLQPTSFQPKPVEDLRNSKRTSDQQMPVEDLHGPLGPDHESLARRAIYNRLLVIENEVKRRGLRGFARYMVPICIGVAATLAWQSYNLAKLRQTVEKIAAGQDLMAGEITKLQSAYMELLAKIPSPPAPAPAAPSIDPEQVHQITVDLTALRQTVEKIDADQDQMAGEITKLQGSYMELLAKIPSPPARPPAAHARKPAPTASRAPQTLIPSHP